MAVDPFGLRWVEVRPGENHAGEPVIFIEAGYDLSETPIDPEVNGKLSLDLWLMLLDAGEMRFPHVRHKYHEQQTVKSRPKGKSRRRATS